MDKTDEDMNNTGVNENASPQDNEALMQTSSGRSTTVMLLLEDATFDQLPSHIHRALEALRLNRPSKMHILKAFVYIISLESGFHPIQSRLPSFNQISGCFNIARMRENINYINEISPEETVLIKLALIESAAENTYKLLIREIGDALCITFSHKNEPGKSICLIPTRYVLNATLTNPPKCFNNLKELSYKLKEFIFAPIRNRTFECNVQNQTFASLTGLPSEVVWLIFRKLKIKSLQNLSKTCTQMRSEINRFRQSMATRLSR